MNIGGGIGQLGMAGLPKLLNLLEQLQKTGPPLPLVRRKISSAKERFEIRR